VFNSSSDDLIRDASHFHPNNRTPDERWETRERFRDSDSIEVKEKNSRTDSNQDKQQSE
jgi:hypothetical protein